MDAGKLDRRISIERAFATTDAVGGEVLSWLPLRTVWAEVRQISDGERWRAAEVSAFATTRFTVRWDDDAVEETDRILYDGGVYEIVGIKEIGRRVGQEITASARVEA